jgi:hypothetical protein
MDWIRVLLVIRVIQILFEVLGRIALHFREQLLGALDFLRLGATAQAQRHHVIERGGSVFASLRQRCQKTNRRR